MIEELRDKLEALAAKKRAELEAALDRREVQDPFTIAGVVITWQAIAVSAAVSVAASAASFALSRAMAPKPPKQVLGRLQGTLHLQNSEQGILIPEIYGAGPAASIVAGASPTYQNKTNCTDGANGSITKTGGANNTYNAGASHNVAITTGQDAFIRVIRGSGFAAAGFFSTASPTGSGEQTTGMIFGVAWHNAGPFYTEINGDGTPQGNTVAGDEFTIELRSGRFHLYKGTAEVVSFGAAIPAPSYPLYFGVIMYTTGAGVSNAKIKINDIGDPPNYAKGGIKVPAIIDWSSGIRKHVSTTEHQAGGKGFLGGKSQTVENITYDIDLGLTFGRGELNLLREYANADILVDQTATSLLLSGIYDPTVGADSNYDPAIPPNPREDYVPSLDRQDANLAIDGDGVGTGTVQGGGSGIAIYPGNQTQDPDPTEEAAIDGKYGSGSTTAHRGKARIVHTNFDLSRWGGIVPNMTAAWENATLTNLSLIYASLCERVNVKAATSDYDFSGLVTIKPRGMLIAGRLFSPAEIIGSPEIQTVYNYTATEAEGQIIGWIEGSEPTVTIADTEIGWMDSDAELGDILPEVDTIMAAEIGLARQVDVKYIDLDKDWESNTQSDNRQTTEGVSTEVLEVQVALLASEARSVAQRKLYRDYVAGSVHRFTLPWTYLYLYPGYKITVTRAEGFSHVMKLTSISGGLGVLDCEGVAIEPAAYTQPAVVNYGPGIQPVQSIPAMTILTFLDTPFLRDADEKRENVGYYVCGTPRTGVGQSWLGFALFQNRNNTWNLVNGGSNNLPGTIGTVVSATGLNTADTSIFDRTGVIVVDLYGTSASLASVTENDVLLDPHVNQAVVGDMVIQFVTATQVSGFPNRWSLSVLLNGRRGTEAHVTDTFTSARFVMVNAAVVFVPAMATDLNNLMEYRGVTSGQSLTDAAIVEFAWTGGTAKPLPPSSLRGERDSDDNLLILWNRRSRIGAGLRPYSDVPLAEEQEKYIVEIPDATPPRSWPVIMGMGIPALLESSGITKFADIDVNTLSSTASNLKARSIQEITETDNYVEATLSIPNGGASGEFAGFGIIQSSRPWKPLTGGDLGLNADYFIRYNFNSVGGYFRLTFFRDDVNITEFNIGTTNPGDVRIRLVLTESEVRFVRDWQGDATPPFYVSPIPPSFPVRAIAIVLGNGVDASEVADMMMTISPQPATVYTADQMTQDGLIPVLGKRIRTAQVSALVGVGGWAEAVIGFLPDSISGLLLWLRADVLSLADGAAVSTWPDDSGNANDATQATPASQPVFKTAIRNGRPVIRFNDDYVDLATDVQINGRTIFVVGDSIGAVFSFTTILGSSNNTEQVLRVEAGGPTFTSTQYATLLQAYPANNATNWFMFTGIGGPASNLLSRIGRDEINLTSPKFNGDIAEVIVYNSALTTAQITAVQTYLIAKYAL